MLHNTSHTVITLLPPRITHPYPVQTDNVSHFRFSPERPQVWKIHQLAGRLRISEQEAEMRSTPDSGDTMKHTMDSLEYVNRGNQKFDN